MRLHLGLVVLACCVSQAAWAQKVVVLEFEGDKGGKLHAQVEAALKKAKVVELVPIATWKAAAAKKKLKGAQAMTPSAVGKISFSVAIDAAVEGALGETFFVRILDREGGELWSKDLPLKKSLISDDHAKKLAKAVAAAAKTGQDKKEKVEPKPEPEPEAEVKPKDKKHKRPPAEETEEKPSGEEAETSSEETSEEPARRPVTGGNAEHMSAEEAAEANAATQNRGPSESDKDRDLEEESVKKVSTVRPKVVSLWLAGTTTGRSYCSRPGVATCAEYDLLPENERPTGDTVEFSPQVPYAGFSVVAEIFPLSTLYEKMGGFGVGLVANFALGFSLTNVKIQLPTGTTSEQQVVSTDRNWGTQLALRWNFSLGTWKYRGVSHIGIRGGIGGRTFEIDAAANVPLPGPDRFYGQLGADISFRPIKWAGLDLSATVFLGPTPGATVILGYGDLNAQSGGAESSGFLIEGGLSGDLIGPLGYNLKLRYQNFSDKFFGQGKKWTTPCDSGSGRCGGADQEQYFQFLWGLVGAF